MKKALLGTAFAIGLAQSAAAATFTIYTDRAAFDAATSNTSTENFNDVVGEPSFNGQDLIVGDLTLRNDVSTNPDRGLIDQPPAAFASFDVDGTAVANILTRPTADFSIGFASDIFAFGADFAALNNEIQRTVFNVLGENILAPIQPQETVQFFGFTSDMAFDAFSISSFGGENDGFGMDNVTYGGVAAVPLPASALLLFGALGLMGASRRRA